MNVLQAHKFFWKRDGASNYFLYLSDLLRNEGHEVIPFSMHHPKAEKSSYSPYFVSQMDLDDPSRVSFFKKMQYAGRMFYSFEAKKKMRNLLDQKHIDIVHLHNIYHHISPSILPVIKKQNIPIVMTLHDYKLICPNYSLFHDGAVHEEDCRGWYGTCVENACMKGSVMQSRIVRAEMVFHHKIMKYYERLVDRFIAPSEFMIDLCVKYGWPREKFVHIPNAVDLQRFSVSKKDGTEVVYVGRVSEEKGLMVLLDAAKQTPEIPYTIVGTGPQEKELKKRVKKEKISNVAFTGFLSGKELDTAMKNARLFVLPAIWYENNPLSIIEASAMGKITIGSYIGGIPELLPTQFLATPTDDKDLAQTIKKWYTASIAIRKKEGKLLRENAEKQHNSAEHVARIVSLYHDLS